MHACRQTETEVQESKERTAISSRVRINLNGKVGTSWTRYSQTLRMASSLLVYHEEYTGIDGELC